MSKARRLEKMRKKAEGRPGFLERLQEGLLEALAWAKSGFPLRTTVLTETTRTTRMRYVWKEEAL